MLYRRSFWVPAFALGIALAASPGRAESLSEALASAYTSNPQITSALLSVKASTEDIAAAQSGYLPHISASAETGASRTEVGGNTKDSQSSSVSLSGSQVLFDSLKTGAGIESARAVSVVASEALRNAEQNVLLSAATAYVAVVRDTQLVQLRADNVKFFQAQVQSAKDRLQIGEGTRIDVSQAEARLASAVASYKAAVNSLKTSQASYERWVGHKPQNLSLQFNFGPVLPGSLDLALSLGDTRNPAILSARAQLRAAQSATNAAWSAFGPTLALIGSISSSYGDLQSGSKGTTNTGSIALRLSVPIFDGGASFAAARKANINQIKSEIDALSVRDQVREAVISAWSGLQNASAQIESAKSAVAASQLALEGVIEERNVGQRTTLDVLNARADLTTAQEGQIGAQTSRYTAAFSLIAAAGQLSAQDLGLAVQLRSPDGDIQSVGDVWKEMRSVTQ